MTLTKSQMIDLEKRLLSLEAMNVTPSMVKQWTDDVSSTLANYLPDTNLSDVVDRTFVKSWTVMGSMLGGEVRYQEAVEENSDLSFGEKIDSVKGLLRILCCDLRARIELS